MEFLRNAFSAADEIAAFDPLLQKPENTLLREAMESRFGVVVLRRGNVPISDNPCGLNKNLQIPIEIAAKTRYNICHHIIL